MKSSALVTVSESSLLTIVSEFIWFINSACAAHRSDCNGLLNLHSQYIGSSIATSYSTAGYLLIDYSYSKAFRKIKHGFTRELLEGFCSVSMLT